MLSYLDEFFALSRLKGEASANVQYYLTDHEELKLDYFESVTDREFTDSTKVYDRILANAKREFLGDFYQVIGNYFDYVDVISSGRAGKIKDPRDVVPVETDWRGLNLKVANSRWLSMYVADVMIYIGYPNEEEVIRIYDGVLGNLLWSKTIPVEDLTTGWNRIVINQSFPVQGQSKNYLIVRANSANDVHQTTISYDWYADCACTVQCFDKVSIQGIVFEGASPTFIARDGDTDGLAHGLILDFGLICDREQLILANLQSFLPLFYKKLVIEALKFIQASDRTNDDTLNMDRDRIGGILFGKSGQFASDKQPGLVDDYKGMMDAVCNGIHRTTSDICFECKSEFTARTVLP